jgi:hypothetical protein
MDLLTLFGIAFLPSLATVAGGAVAVPIIIHLLNRKRFQIVTWAAMRFLLAAQRKNVRRLKLEQWLLLALRALIALLLVVAMAAVYDDAEKYWRELFPGGTTAPVTQGRTHRILVLDGCFSMATKLEDDSTRFDAAKAQAKAILDRAGPGDGFSVVLLSSPAQVIVAGPADDRGKVLRQIDGMKLPHGSADITGGLRLVADMVGKPLGKYARREVTFLTDLKRTNWNLPKPEGAAEAVTHTGSGSLAESWQTIAKNSRVIFLDVARQDVDNLAVTNLTLGEALPLVGVNAIVTAEVRNFGRLDRRKASVGLFIGKTPKAGQKLHLQEMGEQLVDIPAGQSVKVTFALDKSKRFMEAGEYLLQVRLSEDLLTLDDSRSLMVKVRDTIPVMVVNGKIASDKLERADEFVMNALNPFPKSMSSPPAPGRPERRSMREFEDAGLSDLSKFDCVILCDVPTITADEAHRLEAHLRRGGSIIIGLGPKSADNLETYNRLLWNEGKGILPGRLLGVKEAAKGESFHFFATEEAFRLPPLSTCFQDDRVRAGISTPMIFRYVQVDAPANGPARRIFSYAANKINAAKLEVPENTGPSDAAIIDFPRQRGRVILVTTTLNVDPKWTDDWPLHPTFPAFLNETLRYVAATDSRHTLLTGEPLEEYVSFGQVGLTAKRFRYEGNREKEIDSAEIIAQDDAGFFRFSTNDQSGIFSFLVGTQPDPLLIAVNVPMTTPAGGPESDLRRIGLSDLQATAPDADLQLVTDARNIEQRKAAASDKQAGAINQEPRGPAVARVLLLILLGCLLLEVLLAWYLGSARAGQKSDPLSPRIRRWGWYRLLWGLPVVLTMAVLGTVIHASLTGEFLGFLPQSWRLALEHEAGVPAAAPGEGTRWKLEKMSYLSGDAHLDRWLIGGLMLAAVGMVIWIYGKERIGTDATAGKSFWRHPLTGLASSRIALILVTLFVLLPQLQLTFEREGWPDIVIVFDDSRSMSIVDSFQDPLVREKAELLKEQWKKLAAPRIEKIEKQLGEIHAKLAAQPSAEEAQKLREDQLHLEARLQDLRTPHRLNLIKALLASSSQSWLHTFLTERQMRVHVYRASTEATPLKAVLTDPSQCDRMLEEIIDIIPHGESSRLGESVERILQDFRGGSLNGIIMFTDGVTTGGPDLSRAGRTALAMEVPLYIVGVGDSQEAPDIILSDLRAEKVININDRLIIEAQVRTQGAGMPASVPVILSEIKNGKQEELVREKVQLSDKPEKVKLSYTPKEAGEKRYVIEIPVQAGESDTTNNRLEHEVFVDVAKRVKVLYIEGKPRYEYRFIKTLFERETEAVRGNKSIDLDIFLVGAHPDFAKQDKSALAEFPTQSRLDAYDVILLGDVDPRQLPRGEATVTMLADFVKKRGGGLLMIAGEDYAPHAYKDTDLADVLPISLEGVAPVALPKEDDPPIVDGYRPQLTPAGQNSPLFRFVNEDADNALIWEKLPKLLWFSRGYKRKLSAEVLAVHPQRLAEGGANKDELHPLVLQQFVGGGRVMFFGFDETWRWRFRQDELRFNQFWIQAIRTLARSRVGRIELRVDRKQFRRGEPIRVTATFPDDAPPPPPGTEVKVTVERTPPKQPGAKQPDPETHTLILDPVGPAEPPTRVYEALLTRTQEGEYKFTLTTPTVVGTPPRTRAGVLPPLGEMDNRRLNETDLQRAARDSHGAYYPLNRAEQLMDELPNGPRVALDQPCEPLKLWNRAAMFALVFSLLVTEWVLRKRWRLL